MSKRIFCSMPILLIPLISFAHFGMIIPSRDIIMNGTSNTVKLKVMFVHPFEGNTMVMEKPLRFGVFFKGEKHSLLSHLSSIKVKGYGEKKGHRGWEITYKFKHPGDYIFYCKPKPYWEPAEDKFIVHYTKVIVNAFGLEEGWDSEIGLKTEIIPLTRPYGLYTNNTFQGLVKVDGKPAPFTEVEVEYYNKDGKLSPPAPPFITQVIKCDFQGIFTYTMPKAGWWGFAALNEGKKKMSYKGKPKDVEIGAVLWVKTYDMR